jgi:hypothetical protein
MPRDRLDDPWLTGRMRKVAQVAAAEQDVYTAVTSAMRTFLTQARAAVLHLPAPAGLVAVAAGPPPDLSLWPDDPVWLSLVESRVAPVVGNVFGDAFAEYAARALIADEPYRLAYLEEVSDRLSPRLWPRDAFEEVRYELLEGTAAGETGDQLRGRVARVLDLDAPTREVRGEIAEVEDELAEPDLPAPEERRLRARRRDLYDTAHDSQGVWRERASRIARTESMGALNGGSYQGTAAYSKAAGVAMWKQWWATADPRTRPDHQQAHGQVQPLDTPFLVGGWEMQHPHAAGAPASEVVNCRCTCLFLTEEEAARERAERPDAQTPDVQTPGLPTTAGTG